MLKDDLSGVMIRQINKLYLKRKGMDALELLELAVRLMWGCNKTHCHEIFMDISLDKEEECINFDITSSNLGHAYQLQELLNMTVHSEPAGDKIKYSLLP